MTVRLVSLLLTLLTGFTALVYQVAWQKYLAVLLGAHAEATAAVLGIFLGGLALGYALLGRISGRLVERAARAGRRPPLLETYGLVEAAIGVYAFCFPLLFSGIQRVSVWLPASSPGLAFGIDVLLTVLLIGPPAVLMGGTIPFLTQGLSRTLEDATRLHALVYAFNTAGAFAGALCAGLYLVPVLGLRGCVFAMGALNVLAGLVFLALGRFGGGGALPAARPGGAPARLSAWALAAGLGGFSMMTLQTALNRVGALSLGASHFTFAMVVAAFVLSIALGSLTVTLLPKIRPAYLVGSQWLLVAILLAAYAAVPDAPYWTLRVRQEYPGAPENFYPFHLHVFGWSLLLLLLPVGLSGASLPLMFHHLRREVGELGTTAGRLYAWNTVGSLLGALFGGYLVLFWLDLHHAYRMAVGALAIAATLLTGLALPGAGRWAAAPLGAVILTLALLPPWPPEKLASGLFRQPAEREVADLGPDEFIERDWKRRGMEIVFYDDDPSTSVAVIDSPEGAPDVGLAVINNGKSDGNVVADRLTMGIAAVLPAALAKDPERAFVIGYGTGYTVGVMAQIESVKEVVVAEISPAVVEAATYFDPYNFGAKASPKTRIVRSDAYRALLRSGERYDVIVSEPPNPWVAGVEMLYSREFLEDARRHLTPGGIYAQWFHLYEMDDATTELVLNTYRQVFGRVSVWAGTSHDVIILGWADDEARVDLASMRARFAQEDYARLFSALGIDSFNELLAHEVVPAEALAGTELDPRVHTLLHPILSHDAARAFFVGGVADLPPTNRGEAARAGARNSLVRRTLAALDPEARQAALLEIATETCAHYAERCLALLARLRHDDPDSAELARLLETLRGQAESNARSYSERNLDFVSRLFDPKGITDQPRTYETAARVLSLFDRFYHHAVPFDARALMEAWKRCRRDLQCALEIPRIEQIGVAPD